MARHPTALAELLRRRRGELGYSRTRAAQLSAVNASTIEAWELGRVGKPPLHDVLRLARVLSISTAELEQAVIAEQPPGAPASVADRDARPEAISLLERAIALLGWDDDDTAGALSTSSERVRGLRRGQAALSVLDVMALIAALGALPSGAGGASAQEVADLLAQLRHLRAS